eukprot:4783003-Karenia_brevis.AAC.1
MKFCDAWSFLLEKCRLRGVLGPSTSTLKCSRWLDCREPLRWVYVLSMRGDISSCRSSSWVRGE